MNIAVFGDLGGHMKPYVSALQKLDVDVNNTIIPKDLTIIQVGDLIDRGPDSGPLVNYVNKLIYNNPENYIQLLGNHEGRLLGGPQFMEQNGKEYPLSKKATHNIQKWWLSRKANMAVGISCDKTFGELLVTHAGLTPWLYKKLNTESLHSIVLTLNSLRSDQAFLPGIMLGGHSWNAGVAWADSIEEVYLPWYCADSVPFGQIHGHTRLYNYNKKKWKDISSELLPHAHVDHKAKHTTIWIKNKPFIGIDPGYGVYDPGSPIVPFIAEGTLIGPQ